MLLQMQCIVVALVIWLFVMRIKRVEVQVTQAPQENTHAIFAKLKCAFVNHITFMAALLIFQMAMLVYIFTNNLSWKLAAFYPEDFDKRN